MLTNCQITTDWCWYFYALLSQRIRMIKWTVEQIKCYNHPRWLDSSYLANHYVVSEIMHVQKTIIFFLHLTWAEDRGTTWSKIWKSFILTLKSVYYNTSHSYMSIHLSSFKKIIDKESNKICNLSVQNCLAMTPSVENNVETYGQSNLRKERWEATL